MSLEEALKERQVAKNLISKMDLFVDITNLMKSSPSITDLLQDIPIRKSTNYKPKHAFEVMLPFNDNTAQTGFALFFDTKTLEYYNFATLMEHIVLSRGKFENVKKITLFIDVDQGFLTNPDMAKRFFHNLSRTIELMFLLSSDATSTLHIFSVVSVFHLTIKDLKSPKIKKIIFTPSIKSWIWGINYVNHFNPEETVNQMKNLKEHELIVENNPEIINHEFKQIYNFVLKQLSQQKDMKINIEFYNLRNNVGAIEELLDGIQRYGINVEIGGPGRLPGFLYQDVIKNNGNLLEFVSKKLIKFSMSIWDLKIFDKLLTSLPLLKGLRGLYLKFDSTLLKEIIDSNDETRLNFGASFNTSLLSNLMSLKELSIEISTLICIYRQDEDSEKAILFANDLGNHIIRHLGKELEMLSLVGVPNLTSEIGDIISRNCPNLIGLRLGKTRSVDVNFIQKMMKLKFLRLRSIFPLNITENVERVIVSSTVLREFEHLTELSDDEHYNFFCGIFNRTFNVSLRLHELKNNAISPTSCEYCIGTMEPVVEMSRNNTNLADIEAFILKRCDEGKKELHEICLGMSTSYPEEGVFVLKHTNFTADQICGAFIADCKSADDPLNEMWKFDIPSGKPPVKGWPKVSNPQKTLRVLHLTDIHIDHKYAVGSEADCKTESENEKLLCCRDYSEIKNEKINVPAGYWGSPYACDIPYRTFVHGMEHISKNDKFDYIIITGDFESHDTWEYSKTKTMTNVMNITEVIQSYFPKTPIYQATGNHEGVPMDALGHHSMPEYSTRGPQWLYNTFAQAWKRDLPESTSAGIKYRASYAIKPYKGLKIISLNTVYCSKNNFYNYLNQTDPDDTMAWLAQELLESEKENEKVHIISHIPPGSSYCLKGWSFNFYELVYRFEDTIAALIYGHVHKDFFEVYYEKGDVTGRPYHVNYVAPSFTTFKNSNPAYRVYTIDGNYEGSSFTVIESETYYANLTGTNEEKAPKWELEYKLKEEYGMNDLSPESFHNLITKFENQKELFEKYYLYYNRNYIPCESKCRKNAICILRQARSYDKANFCHEKNIMLGKKIFYIFLLTIILLSSNHVLTQTTESTPHATTELHENVTAEVSHEPQTEMGKSSSRTANGSQDLTSMIIEKGKGKIIKVGHIGALNAMPNAELILEMCRKELWREGILDDEFDIELLQQRACGESFEGVAVAADMFHLQDVKAFIGPYCNAEMDAVSKMASYWNVPIIGYMAASSTFSDKNIYKTLARVSIRTINTLAYAVASTLKHYNWKNAAIVTNTGVVALDRLVAFEENFHKLGINILRKITFDENSDAKSIIETGLMQDIKNTARIIICIFTKTRDMTTEFMKAAVQAKMDTNDFVYIFPWIQAEAKEPPPWIEKDGQLNANIKKLFSNGIIVDDINGFDNTLTTPFVEKMEKNKLDINELDLSNVYGYIHLYDSLKLYALTVRSIMNKTGGSFESITNGKKVWNEMRRFTFPGLVSTEGVSAGMVLMDDVAERAASYGAFYVNPDRDDVIKMIEMEPVFINNCDGLKTKSGCYDMKVSDVVTGFWPSSDGRLPKDVPDCGYRNENCDYTLYIIIVVLSILIIGLIVGGLVISRILENRVLANTSWRIWRDDTRVVTEDEIKSMLSIGSSKTRMSNMSKFVKHHAIIGTNTHASYHAYPQKRLISFIREDIKLLNQMKLLVHDNINPFLGMSFNEKDEMLIYWKFCSRGTVQDIIYNDEVNIDANFHAAFVRDITAGLEYLHLSSVQYHGSLTSWCCLIDRNWMVKITDYAVANPIERWTKQGMIEAESVKDGDNKAASMQKSYILYCSPETLKATESNKRRNMEQDWVKQTSARKQSSDIYSFGIVMYEILYRGLPFPDDLNIDELSEGNKTGNATIKPSIQDRSKIHPDLCALLLDCWNTNPDVRPSIKRVKLNTEHYLKVKGSLVDQMMRVMEQYANNLEKLVQERTGMLEEANIRADKLLSQLLPSYVANELKLGRSVPPKMFEQASVMFSDIVGFTKICGSSSPLEVVNFLNSVYTGFDDIINRYDAYKVETIGDAYLVVSGIPQENGVNHLANLADVTLGMMEFLQTYIIPHKKDEKLRIRLGLHTGPVAAGVVGLTAPRYCLFGDTVNTASRMESTGIPEQIQISTLYNERLAKHFPEFDTSLRGTVAVKGKGEIITYWLEGKNGKNITAPIPLEFQNHFGKT
uniref:Guanylate cyclase n=1 Tax=Parastrongyloides trichosuri TaxID=131310 RepID=A0A0N4ZDC3_PARTI